MWKTLSCEPLTTVYFRSVHKGEGINLVRSRNRFSKKFFVVVTCPCIFRIEDCICSTILTPTTWTHLQLFFTKISVDRQDCMDERKWRPSSLQPNGWFDFLQVSQFVISSIPTTKNQEQPRSKWDTLSPLPCLDSSHRSRKPPLLQTSLWCNQTIFNSLRNGPHRHISLLEGTASRYQRGDYQTWNDYVPMVSKWCKHTREYNVIIFWIAIKSLLSFGFENLD